MKQKINKSLQTYSNRNRLLKSNGYEDYATYLLSDHWRSVKANIPEIMKYCHCCGSKKKLELHHKSYNSMLDKGKLYKNIMYVCNLCHDKIHAIQREKNISIAKAGDILKTQNNFSTEKKNRALEKRITMKLGRTKRVEGDVLEANCKTCGGEMRRRTSKSPTAYFLYWDVCILCSRVQHYQQAKNKDWVKKKKQAFTTSDNNK